MALLAAKGAAAAQKARDGAREAVRGARREIKTFQLNQGRAEQRKIEQMQAEFRARI